MPRLAIAPLLKSCFPSRTEFFYCFKYIVELVWSSCKRYAPGIKWHLGKIHISKRKVSCETTKQYGQLRFKPPTAGNFPKTLGWDTLWVVNKERKLFHAHGTHPANIITGWFTPPIFVNWLNCHLALPSSFQGFLKFFQHKAYVPWFQFNVSIEHHNCLGTILLCFF